MTEVVTWHTESAGITVVSLARPPANALGVPILEGMHAAIDAAEQAELVLSDRKRRADQHRRHRGGQGARPRCDQPQPDRAQGRLGNLPKSGGRLSR